MRKCARRIEIILDSLKNLEKKSLNEDDLDCIDNVLTNTSKLFNNGHLLHNSKKRVLDAMCVFLVYGLDSRTDSEWIEMLNDFIDVIMNETYDERTNASFLDSLYNNNNTCELTQVQKDKIESRLLEIDAIKNKKVRKEELFKLIVDARDLTNI